MPKLRRLKPGFGAINRNLCNYPLARDARVRARWRRSTKTGRWLCDLLGDDRIQLRLPGNAGKRRGPTGFDIQVLFLLLREARVRDTGKVEFASFASLLKALGVCVGDYNRRRLRDALALWLLLCIRYREWFEPRRNRRGKRIRKLLPPPIRSINTDRRHLHVTIAKEWREIAERYYAQVSLPLPPHAAAQNLVLCLITSALHPHDEPGIEFRYQRRIGVLCEKLGLNHATRGRALDHAIQLAGVWYAERGLKLNEVRKDGEIIFYLTELQETVERQRSRRTTAAAQPKPASTGVEADANFIKKSKSEFPTDLEDDDEQKSDQVFDENGNPVADDGVA